MLISIEEAKKMIIFLLERRQFGRMARVFLKQRGAIAWQIDHNNQQKNERKPKDKLSERNEKRSAGHKTN